MRNRVTVLSAVYIVLISVLCLSFNPRSTAPEFTNEGAAIFMEDQAALQMRSMHLYQAESIYFPQPTSLPTSLPVPTVEPSLASTTEPTPAPTITFTPAPTRAPTVNSTPTPTRAPAATSTPFPSSEPIPTLTLEMVNSMTADQLERSALALSILNNQRITLARMHPSGVKDNAFAYNNIIDTYYGKPAQRSRYQNAPGGSVVLDAKMLKAILHLAEKYTFTISEIAGASHSKTSNHYDGVAFDIANIDGRYATYNSLSRAFAAEAKRIGATTAIVESTCVHIDFK